MGLPSFAALLLHDPSTIVVLPPLHSCLAVATAAASSAVILSHTSAAFSFSPLCWVQVM